EVTFEAAALLRQFPGRRRFLWSRRRCERRLALRGFAPRRRLAFRPPGIGPPRLARGPIASANRHGLRLGRCHPCPFRRIFQRAWYFRLAIPHAHIAPPRYA